VWLYLVAAFLKLACDDYLNELILNLDTEMLKMFHLIVVAG